MSTLATIALLLLLVSPALAGPPKPPDLTADQVMTFKGDKQSRGKIYVSGNRMRNDMELGERKLTTILDWKLKKSWVLMPPPLGCVEQPLTDDPKNPFATANVESNEELIGSETIDGHPTKKYRVTSSIDGKKYVGFQWRATDLGGVVLRHTDEPETYRVEYRNVVLGKPDAKLLEPPSDCKAGFSPMGMQAPGGRKK